MPPATADGDQRPATAADTTHRTALIGYLAWAVLFGAVFAWEGLALAG